MGQPNDKPLFLFFSFFVGGVGEGGGGGEITFQTQCQ
jgi:hypothetical protein